MTIEEAIKHSEEVAEEKDKSVELYKAVKATEGLITKCEKCAKEHRQLAEWLKELKQLRKQTQYLEQGEWISEKVDGEDWKGCKRQYYQPISCSKCHSPNHYKSTYCPNCGARMVGPKAESEE